MSVDSFIPSLWAGSLLRNLNQDHVYAQGFNRDYDGEISMGATLTINSVGRITISNYSKNTDLAAPQVLQTAGQSLVIDQGKSFHFFVDDLDKVQMKASIREEAMYEASFGLADATDTFLGTTLANALPSANTLTAATVGNGAAETDAYNTLVQLRLVLDQNNVPDGNRYVFVPAWWEAFMLTDPRFVSFGTSGNLDVLHNGTKGFTAAGFTVLKSNNFPTSGGNAVILASYKGAATFAEQIDKTEAYRPPLRFGDAVKGLHIYGAKVTRPLAVAGIVGTKGTF